MLYVNFLRRSKRNVTHPAIRKKGRKNVFYNIFCLKTVKMPFDKKKKVTILSCCDIIAQRPYFHGVSSEDIFWRNYLCYGTRSAVGT